MVLVSVCRGGCWLSLNHHSQVKELLAVMTAPNHAGAL